MLSGYHRAAHTVGALQMVAPVYYFCSALAHKMQKTYAPNIIRTIPLNPCMLRLPQLKIPRSHMLLCNRGPKEKLPPVFLILYITKPLNKQTTYIELTTRQALF